MKMAKKTETQILAFATLKGGVGKTTLSYNIGCQVASKGKKVLMIDADPQSNLTSNFNYDIYDKEAYTIRMILESGEEAPSPEELVIKMPMEAIPTLDLIPNTMWSFLTDENLASKSYREQILLEYFNENEKFFRQYDYIIFDCNPGIGIVNQNVFTLTDKIIMISDPDVNSARGSDLFVRMWMMKKDKKSPLKICGLIMNNMEKTKISNELKEYLAGHELFGKVTLEHSIPHTTAFKDAASNNVPLFLLKKSGGGIASAKLALNNLIDEMYERGIL